MRVILTDEGTKALEIALAALADKPQVADLLRRTFEFDLANLQIPSDEEKQRIAYASMH